MLKKILFLYRDGSATGNFYFKEKTISVHLSPSGSFLRIEPEGLACLTVAVPLYYKAYVFELLQLRNSLFPPFTLLLPGRKKSSAEFIRWSTKQPGTSIDGLSECFKDEHSFTVKWPVTDDEKTVVVTQTFSLLDKTKMKEWEIPLGLLSLETSDRQWQSMPIPPANVDIAPSLNVNFVPSHDKCLKAIATDLGSFVALYPEDTELDDVIIEFRPKEGNCLFRSSEDLKFITLYNGEEQVFFVENAPPFARVGEIKYPLPDIITEFINLYENIISHPMQMEEPPMIYCSELVHKVQVDGVGVFEAYLDKRIRVRFEDRTLLELIFHCDTAKIVDDRGDTIQVRIDKPLYYKKYIKAGVDFANWAFGKRYVDMYDKVDQVLETSKRFLDPSPS